MPSSSFTKQLTCQGASPAVALPVTLAELCQSLNNSHSIASPSFVTGRAVALTCPELCRSLNNFPSERLAQSFVTGRIIIKSRESRKRRTSKKERNASMKPLQERELPFCRSPCRFLFVFSLPEIVSLCQLLCRFLKREEALSVAFAAFSRSKKQEKGERRRKRVSSLLYI
jgi:hypothetical protein